MIVDLEADNRSLESRVGVPWNSSPFRFKGSEKAKNLNYRAQCQYCHVELDDRLDLLQKHKQGCSDMAEEIRKTAQKQQCQHAVLGTRVSWKCSQNRIEGKTFRTIYWQCPL